MKDFLKGEGIPILTSALTFSMALFVLEIFMCFGMFTKNKGLVITVIYMFLFVTVILCIILLAQAGKLFLKRLRDVNYYRTQSEKGKTPLSIVTGFNVLYGLFLFGMVALYLGLLGIDTLWSTKVFPEEKEGISKIWKNLFPGNGAATFLATLLEFITIAVLFTALAVFCSVMAYNLFTKSKYAGILAAVFFVMFAAAVTKLNVQLFGNMPTLTYHFASAAFCAALAAVLILITVASLKKRNWIEE